MVFAILLGMFSRGDVYTRRRLHCDRNLRAFVTGFAEPVAFFDSCIKKFPTRRRSPGRCECFPALTSSLSVFFFAIDKHRSDLSSADSSLLMSVKSMSERDTRFTASPSSPSVCFTLRARERGCLQITAPALLRCAAMHCDGCSPRPPSRAQRQTQVAHTSGEWRASRRMMLLFKICMHCLLRCIFQGAI